MNVLANINVFTEKCYNLKSSGNNIGKLDAGINQLARVVDAYVGSNKMILFWSNQKHQKKRKSKTNFKLLPNKRKKHPYSERVRTKADMMKHYYKAKISLS